MFAITRLHVLFGGAGMAADPCGLTICATFRRALGEGAPLPPIPSASPQVLWTYGDRSSEDFFCYHGFVLPNNAQEEVQLWGSAAELAAWFCEANGLQDGGGRLRGAAGEAGGQAVKGRAACYG